MKTYYKYPVYQRDGNNLIEIKKITRKEYEQIYEKVKEEWRELILFRWTFLVYKRKEKWTETPKIID